MRINTINICLVQYVKTVKIEQKLRFYFLMMLKFDTLQLRSIQVGKKFHKFHKIFKGTPQGQLEKI